MQGGDFDAMWIVQDEDKRYGNNLLQAFSSHHQKKMQPAEQISTLFC
jgi:hypothetical protein